MNVQSGPISWGKVTNIFESFRSHNEDIAQFPDTEKLVGVRSRITGPIPRLAVKVTCHFASTESEHLPSSSRSMNASTVG